jgi:hypothetical protein
MAYIKILWRKCAEPSCERQATHEVIDHQNRGLGCFCHRHARHRLTEQLIKESRTPKRVVA